MARAKSAVKAVIQDPESSKRYWTEVRDASAICRHERPFYVWQHRIAVAALELLETTGRGPKSLVLADAAEELGID